MGIFGEWRGRWVAVVAAAALGALMPVVTGVEVAAQEAQPALPPLRVVVLADESGSLEDGDVVQERDAAKTILFSTLSPGSVMSVVGFGSSDRPGQSPVDVVCPPTALSDAQSRDSIAKCIDGLHKRTEAEGAGTDHAAALQQALDTVRKPGPEKKIVFLLTDGKLDVSNSPQWGDSAERRNAAAAANAQDVLGELEKAGAQVWPLGFGRADTAALGGFARGRSCTPAAANPSAQVVPAAQLTRVVAEAFSSASCAKITPTPPVDVPAGGSVELTAEIPAIAADASILVYKRHPGVQVEYFAPGATRPAPEEGGDRFEFAGQSTDTESVLITGPTPGTWRIRVSSATVPAENVFATVVYQAVVKALLTATPQEPAAGQVVEVMMQIRARDRAVTDQQALQGLTFVTTLTGASGFPARDVRLADPEGDGTFTGQLAVPDDAKGDLAFTGSVTGIGVGGDTLVLNTRVASALSAVQDQILFDRNTAQVEQGGSLTGRVSVTNRSTAPVRLRLELADLTPGTSLTVEPASVDAPPGTAETPFTLRFAEDTRLGGTGGTVRLVDQDNPTRVVDQRLISVEVVAKPTWVDRNLWWLIAVAVVLVALVVAALLWLLARARTRRVNGLRAQLWRGGEVTSDVEPRDPRARAFGFVVHEDFTGPQLQHAGAGESSAYVVRRNGRGLVLRAPGRQPAHLVPGEQHSISPDLSIVVLDERGVPGAAPRPFTPSSGPDLLSAPPAYGASTPPAPGGAPAPFASSGDAPYPSAGAGGNGARPDPYGGPARDGDDRTVYVDPNNPFG
ncbi:VWA domain-containing protein [Saccharothrix sp. Mg75]|uniref:VWA domain-containing protein n=1 Tax=Saccharothrix sp. Mg75 TaxID=3445357 RepID=UPI003EEADE5A